MQLDTPIAGFNGGLFVKPDLSIIEQKTLAQDVAVQILTLLRRHELDVWIYTGNDWLITKPGAPHVAREAWTVKFDATAVSDFSDRLESVAKIVGVSDDLDRVRRCEADVQAISVNVRRPIVHSPTISTSPTKTRTRVRWSTTYQPISYS